MQTVVADNNRESKIVLKLDPVITRKYRRSKTCRKHFWVKDDDLSVDGGLRHNGFEETPFSIGQANGSKEMPIIEQKNC